MAACDGSIAIDGRVYARAPGDTLRPSEAAVDAAGPDTAGLSPLGGAAVRLFQRAADTNVANPDTLLWADVDTTVAGGWFHIGSTAAPYPFTAVLRVRRPGYQGVDVPFAHRGAERHRAVVVLTPLPRSSAPDAPRDLVTR